MIFLKKSHIYLLTALLTLIGSYFLFTYFVQIYFYGLIVIFILIFLQTPRPSRTVDEADMARSRFNLKLITILTFFYGAGGFISLLI